MLIKTENGTATDYSIFTTMPPYDEIVAVESSVFETCLSGNTPATVVIVLEDGTILHTTEFVANGDGRCFNTFDITDQSIANRIIAMFPDVPIHKALEVFLLSPDSGYGWSLGMTFDFPPDYEDFFEYDDCVFLHPTQVFFTVEGEGMPQILDHYHERK